MPETDEKKSVDAPKQDVLFGRLFPLVADSESGVMAGPNSVNLSVLTNLFSRAMIGVRDVLMDFGRMSFVEEPDQSFDATTKLSIGTDKDGFFILHTGPGCMDDIARHIGVPWFRKIPENLAKQEISWKATTKSPFPLLCRHREIEGKDTAYAVYPKGWEVFDYAPLIENIDSMFRDNARLRRVSLEESGLLMDFVLNGSSTETDSGEWLCGVRVACSDQGRRTLAITPALLRDSDGAIILTGQNYIEYNPILPFHEQKHLVQGAFLSSGSDRMKVFGMLRVAGTVGFSSTDFQTYCDLGFLRSPVQEPIRKRLDSGSSIRNLADLVVACAESASEAMPDAKKSTNRAAAAGVLLARGIRYLKEAQAVQLQLVQPEA